MDQLDPSANFTEILSIVSRKVRTVFNARVVAHGLTYPRARALLHLSRKPCLTQTELGCELELENATVVRLLDGMEKIDLIRRTPVEGDRRAKHVVLTRHGRAQAALVEEIVASLRRDILDGIRADDLAVAAAVLRAVGSNVEGLARRPQEKADA